MFARFYRAMLCIRSTSRGPVSVCPSVSPTQVGQTDGQTDTDRPTFSKLALKC